MLFRKKKSETPLSQTFLRRRFHHILIEKRRNSAASPTALRQKRGNRRIIPTWIIKLRFVFAVIVAVMMVSGALYTVFFSSFFTVNKVSIEKNGSAVAGTDLTPFLNKVKGKNILFVNTDTLQKELEQTFKNEILLVKMKKSYPSRIIVKIDEYPAVINVRLITPDDTIQKLIINQIGYTIFLNQEDTQLPVLAVSMEKPVKEKSIFIDQEKLTIIVDAFKKWNDLFGIKLTEGTWKKTERELHLKTEKNFEVWLDLTYSIDKQLLKLKRALTKLDIYRQPLEYIDLRIAGAEAEKVIFKRK